MMSYHRIIGKREPMVPPSPLLVYVFFKKRRGEGGTMGSLLKGLGEMPSL
jgi:hypothetical protein